MRVISDNAADRASLSTTSPMLAGMDLTNLQTDVKTKFCKTTTAANGVLNITASWTVPEIIGGVVLAFTTCSANTTMRIVAYANAADTTPIYDVTKGVVKANYGNHYSTVNSNNLATTGGFYASHWLDSRQTVGKLVITVTDSAGGAVQAGKLIIGDYWQPAIVDMQGTSMSFVDMSEQFRTESGDMYVNVKPQYRKQTISMPSLDKTDRAKMWQLLWRNGMAKPLYISVYPDSANGDLEQVHQIFGRLATNPSMTTPYFSYMAATIDIEEV